MNNLFLCQLLVILPIVDAEIRKQKEKKKEAKEKEMDLLRTRIFGVFLVVSIFTCYAGKLLTFFFVWSLFLPSLSSFVIQTALWKTLKLLMSVQSSLSTLSRKGVNCLTESVLITLLKIKSKSWIARIFNAFLILTKFFWSKFNKRIYC